MVFIKILQGVPSSFFLGYGARNNIQMPMECGADWRRYGAGVLKIVKQKPL